VEVAITPLAGMNGAAGYHTSVVIGLEEFYFSPAGISSSMTLESHGDTVALQRISMGPSRYSGSDMLSVLEGHFAPGTYDLLKKNCNSFTDCALYFLCGERLDWGFRGLEQVGKFADSHIGLVQSISKGQYEPNPRASGFVLEAVIALIDSECDTCDDDDDGDFKVVDSDSEHDRDEVVPAHDTKDDHGEESEYHKF